MERSVIEVNRPGTDTLTEFFRQMIEKKLEEKKKETRQEITNYGKQSETGHPIV